MCVIFNLRLHPDHNFSSILMNSSDFTALILYGFDDIILFILYPFGRLMTEPN